MSVPEQVPYVGYIANGQTTEFPITFFLPDDRYLIVSVNKEKALVGSYTISDGKVLFLTAPKSGTQVELYRSTQLDREFDYKNYDNSFRAETVNFDFDKVWKVLQEQHMVDAQLLARVKEEIEWRRVNDNVLQRQIQILNDIMYGIFDKASQDYLNEKLKAITDAINIAAATGAGANGWTATLVLDSSGKNQQQVNDDQKQTNNELRDAKNLNHAAFVPNGGGSVGVIGGTFRGFAEGINFIVDSAHDKFGFTDISKLDSYTVRVNHDAEFSKVGTLICTTDETLASMGVIAGASVGLGYSDVKIIAPLYFTCKGDGTITKVSPLFEGSVATMAGHNPAGGILRFSHPLKSVGAHQAMVSNRAFVDNIAKPMRVGAFNNDGGTYTQINAYGEQEDNNVWIKHNGTAFEAVQGINKASFSFSFNPSTGGLTITHQTVKSGAYLAIPVITPFNTTNRYVVSAISPTTTTVMCYDPAGNVVKTLDEANWSFFFSIKPATQELSLVPIPATNEFTVFVGNCYVPIDNLQKVPGGNIWLYGAMHK